MIRTTSLLACLVLGVTAPIACSGGGSSGSPSGGSAGAGGAGGGAHAGGLVARISATPEAGDGPLEVTLSGCASTAESGEIVLYSWDFGDGLTATGPVVKHTYSPGDHKASLTITGSEKGSASAEKTISPAGPAPRKLVTDPTGHPRLYFDAGHLAELEGRIQKAPILGTAGYKSSYVTGYLLNTSAWQSAPDYAKKACSDLLGAAFTSTDSSPVSNSRAISDCVTTLAAGGALEPDAAKAKTYADAAVAAMVHMADVWPQSGVKNAGFGRWDCGACADGGSNLNNGELLYAVATSFDLLYGKMSSKDQADVRSLLLREARFAYQASNDPTTWWSKDSGNNWQAVVHGGLGVAALALLGEPGLMPNEAEAWIDRSVERIDKYLETNYDADGVNYEDSDHFGYGLNFAVQFFHALRNVKGDDHFGDKGGILQKAARYRVHATMADFSGIMPNDEASPNASTYPAELLLASALRDGFAQWAWDRVSGQSRPAANSFPFKVGGNGDQSQLLQTALGYDDTVPVESPAGRLPLGKVYPTFGRALFRSSFEDDHGLALMAESGVYGSHGHPNQGHFFFTAYGSTLLSHTGGGGGSGDFNVVRVDGQDQVTPSGSITDFSLLSSTPSFLVTPAVDHVRFDTTAAYTVKLDHATRDLLFVRPAGSAPGYALVFDDLGAGASHTYSTELHFAKGMTVTEVGPGHHKATGSGASVEVFSAEPMGATESTANGLAVSAKAPAASFVTLLFPTDATHALPSVSPLSAGGAAGFSVGADAVLFNPSQKPFTSGTIASDGAVVLARGAAPALELCAVHGGTTFSVGGATWLGASAAVNAVLTPTADGAALWVSKSASSPVDLKVKVPAAGEYVISADDRLLGFATAGGDGLLPITGLDVTVERAIVIRSAAKAPAGCP